MILLMLNKDIKFRAIILAGGKGSRLGNLTMNTPKPLLKIDDKEFIIYVLEYLKKNGINEFIITTSYKHKKFKSLLKNKLKDYKNLKIINEKKALGTGGSLLNVLKNQKTKKKYINLVCNGDSLVLFSLKKILPSIIKYKNLILGLKKNNCKRYGRLMIKKKIVLGIERNNSKKGFISSGIYIFSNTNFKIFNYKNAYLDLEKDVLMNLFKRKKKFFCYKLNKPFIDIGIPKDFKYCKTFIKKNYNEYIKKL